MAATLQTTPIPAEAASRIEALRAVLASRKPSAPPKAEAARPAAVLIPLHYHDGAWHVILNVRSQFVGLHQGEIAFPGGKYEPTDPDMLACALREAHEEMGIAPGDVDVLGALEPVLTRTDYLVWPMVGTIPHPYRFEVDENEVAEIVEIPLDHLLNEAAERHEARLQADGSLLQRKAYAHGPYLVFGATAWILAQLLDLLRSLRPGNEGRDKETA
ncbi:MAG: CoA pyrophosphatase [Chloroflexota bacterium]|nr:CoA pyrophosphatase [Chloroflexota bacterium]MDE2884174.1 CoA pyrophosphatase [Chloroflexota bacterium]